LQKAFNGHAGHAAFFSFGPQTWHHCRISRRRGATRPAQPGNWSPPCCGINGGSWRRGRPRLQP